MSEENKKVNEAEACEQEPKSDKKKRSKKDDEIALLKEQLDQKNDLLIRTAAEFDNFKKRTERERAGIAEFAKAGIIKQLLPILDNIDRAAAADSGSEDYIKGIELIVKQFLGIASTIGIEELGGAGDKFDPNFHEAVMHIEDETLEENVIVEVLQKGYKLGDTVIRPAMVKVAN